MTGRFYRNDTDGSLKAAALRASATLCSSDVQVGTSVAASDVIAVAEVFYQWLRDMSEHAQPVMDNLLPDPSITHLRG